MTFRSDDGEVDEFEPVRLFMEKGHQLNEIVATYIEQLHGATSLTSL